MNKSLKKFTNLALDAESKLDKYVEYWNTGHFDGIENVLCEDYEMLVSPNYEPLKGIESFKQYILRMRTAYPDFHLMIDERVCEKDKFASIWSIEATNTGQGSIPATGKTIKGQGISVIHLKEGKIKDEWIASNNLLWMTQLGYTFIPPNIKPY
jgi:predicted ester cyclase